MPEPIQVTHYLCPATEGTDLTHHLKPQKAAAAGGQVATEMVCTWCRRSQAELVADIEANGGRLHPQVEDPQGGQ